MDKKLQKERSLKVSRAVLAGGSRGLWEETNVPVVVLGKMVKPGQGFESRISSV